MPVAPKTVLCIHDLPGFGRAGLAVITPVLSALGVQAVAVPTAVLSSHTGGLGAPARLSSPGYGPAALAHYRRLGVRFDCIYSGYLSETSQALLVEQAMEYWPDALKVVDPVMGDHGRMYGGLPAEMVPALYNLCARADLILPNTTEAALLLGDPLPGPGATAAEAADAAARLTRVCPQVLVTGVEAGHSILCAGAVPTAIEALRAGILGGGVCLVSEALLHSILDRLSSNMPNTISAARVETSDSSYLKCLHSPDRASCRYTPSELVAIHRFPDESA